MKYFAVCLVLLATIATAEPSSTTLPGVYWLPEKDGQMQVYQKDKKYFGRVISYDVPGQLDEKNPNPEFRSRPIVGVDLLSEFNYDKESERWVGGTIYDAKSGKTYKCRLWFEDDEPGVLWARGYIGISLLGRTERFERVRE